MIYGFHGLAGVGLITLTIVHVYLDVRPAKLPITASMIVDSMSREFYLKEHDPKRRHRACKAMKAVLQVVSITDGSVSR